MAYQGGHYFAFFIGQELDEASFETSAEDVLAPPASAWRGDVAVASERVNYWGLACFTHI